MPIRINLKELIGSDSQGVTVDKLNFNFNKLLELGVGAAGPKGSTGPAGSAGAPGGKGDTGTRGSLWYTGSGTPEPGPIPPNPGGIGVLANDLYVDGDTGDQYEWDGAAWTIVTDLTDVVSTAVSTATSIAFIRDLDVASNPSRFITFNTRGDATYDILGGASSNDMLYLNNFLDSAVALVEADYYTSLLKINTDYRGGNTNKRHAIQIGSFYTPVTTTTSELSETKHDIKISHVHNSIGGAIDLFIGSFNMSVPRDGLSSAAVDNDFESMFEFNNAKNNKNELVTRIGPKDALQKSFSEAVSNGISFSLGVVNAEIGILEGYKIFANSTSKNYLVLQGDETNTDAVLIKDKLVQDGGNIIQTGTGEPLTKDFSSIITHGTGNPTDQQNYGNCGIVKVGDTITVVQGSSSTTPNPGLGITDSTLKGVISVLDATDNTNLESYNKKIGGSLTADFIGVSASDIKVVGNYAYIAHNTLKYDYNYSGSTTTHDNVDLTILDYSTFKDQSASNGFKRVARVLKGATHGSENRRLHRIEIVGSIAIASSQALRNFGDPNTSFPPNNFNNSDHNIHAFDVSNPKEKGILPLKSAALGAGQGAFHSLDLAVKGRYVYTMGLAFSEVGTANADLSYKQFVYRSLINDVSDSSYHHRTVPGDMYVSTATANVNSVNHNNGTISKFGSISINGRHLYSMYRNQIHVIDIEESNFPGASIDTMPVVKSDTFSSNVNIRSMDSKIVGNSLYILYSIAGGSPGTAGYAYDTSGSSGVIKMDIRTPESPVEVWDKEISGCTAASRMTIDGNHIYVAQSLAATNRVFTLEIDGIVADHIDTGYVSANKVQTEEVQTSAINAVAVNSDEIHTRELSAEKVRVQYGTDPSYLMSMNYIGVPVGGIIMWSGNESDIGNSNGDLWNFIECNGIGTIPSTVTDPEGRLVSTLYGGSSVPNLKGRFAIGNDEGGNEYEVGETGGSTTITDENLPMHTHDSGSLETGNSPGDNEGAHLHTINTGRDTTNNTEGGGPKRTDGNAFGTAEFGDTANYKTGTHRIDGSNEGAHQHNIHGDTGDGEFENTQFLPPYYVVTYIMRVA